MAGVSKQEANDTHLVTRTKRPCSNHTRVLQGIFNEGGGMMKKAPEGTTAQELAIVVPEIAYVRCRFDELIARAY